MKLFPLNIIDCVKVDVININLINFFDMTTAVFILSRIIQVRAASLTVLNLITKFEEITIAASEVVSVSHSSGKGFRANLLIGADIISYSINFLRAFRLLGNFP